MTVIICAHGRDFVVVGADTRGTDTFESGARVELNIMEKMFKAGKHITVLVSGDGDYAGNLIELLHKHHGKDHAEVRDAAENLAAVARDDLEKLGRLPLYQGVDSGVGFIVCGLEFPSGGIPRPKSFQLTTEGSYRLGLTQVGYAIDGKSPIPKFIFAKAYRPDMSVENLTTLVALAISETRATDSDVGGRIRIAVIDRSGYHELSREEVEEKTREAALEVRLTTTGEARENEAPGAMATRRLKAAGTTSSRRRLSKPRRRRSGRPSG